MRIVNLDRPDVLNNFIVQDGESNFLQSWEWGDFQKSLGKSIWRLGIEDQGELIGAALIVKNILPLGRSYFYCPRGPVFKSSKHAPYQSGAFGAGFKVPQSNPSLSLGMLRGRQSSKLSAWNLLLEKIREIANKERAIFFRFDFPYPKLPDFLLSRLVKSPASVQPQSTLILDASKPEDEILAQMKPKWRYNIRLASRKGVKVRRGVSSKDLACFLRLLKETVKRNNFKPHPENYYQKISQELGVKGILKIFLAEYQGEIAAANLVLFWGKKATYLHGASANEYRNAMAPHLLQWEQILEAKRRGCTEYDFWGIIPESGIWNLESGIENNREERPWAGITRFKKGFGGKEVYYAGTYDFVLNNFWYKIYRFFR